MHARSHAAAHERYQRLADRVRVDGLTVAEVAKRHKVSVTTVYRACQMHGVDTSTGKRGEHLNAGRTFDILEALIKAPRGATLAWIARKLGLTRQRVWDIYAEARKRGIGVGDWGDPKKPTNPENLA